MTRLSALHHVAAQARRVARHFPLTLLCAGVVCLSGCQAIGANQYPEVPAAWVFPLGLSVALRLPLTLALAAERYRWPRPGCWAAPGGALALLAGGYALAPAQPGLVWNLRLAVLLWLYLGERQEQVLFKSFIFGNGPDYSSEGLLRIVGTTELLGYAATATGRVMLALRYKAAAFPFDSGRARVGRRYRLRTDGNHSWWNCAE
ncbi:hypothetical protein [Hymenobacter bucti]|uniref:Uncharacterized protein n=1 Tax=Hymenobacter bucti TaxID=1844114 RepID=A0ABW4QZW8_9BACT